MLLCKELLCEYRENPLGIDEALPRFCWKTESEEENVLQTAYEIKVDGVWESGKVESGDSVHIVYDGAPLKPFTCYPYAVRVWDNKGNVSEWAEGTFETGLMQHTNWASKWITPTGSDENGLPVFRKTFRANKDVNTGRIYATALGNYEITLNGKRVGEEWMAPGFTSYNKHLLYQTYDVTELLEEENTLCITLAKGWCRGRLAGWAAQRDIYGCQPGILAMVRMEGQDGTVQNIGTDETWEYADSSYLCSDIYDGETYDARLEGNENRNWKAVRLLDYPTEHISAQKQEPVRVTQCIKPIEMIHTPEGDTVIDFGQNMVGWAEFKVSGKAGDRVILSYAEILDKDGNFYNANYRSATNHVEYILRGEGEECYHPHFTFQGFRYVRVDEFPGEVTLDNFVGKVIHSDMKRTGEFRCGNEEVNRLFLNALWGQRGNYVDIPTDCPQRDERLGWTGDAQVFVKTAALNYRVTAFFEKWLTDLRTDQTMENGVTNVVPNVLDADNSAAWGDAATICPWEIYCSYADKRILENQYESMRDWVEYIRSTGDEEYLWNSGNHFGDWLALDVPYGEYVGRTSKHFIATAFYAHSTKLLYQTAEILGKEEEAAKYRTLYENVCATFRAEFVTPRGRLTEDTQTAHVLALQFDLVVNRKRVIERLVELIRENGMKLSTGFVGTPYLCHVLTDNGYADIAYSLLLQTEYPSWLYSVRKGATTMWEHWDGIKPDGEVWSVDMNSYNHYAYGCIADWMYTKAAGIQYDQTTPGYKHIRIAPVPDKRLGFAQASLDTMYGVVQSAWNYEGENIRFKVTVPTNTTATFVLPNGEATELGSGTYQFEIKA